MMGTSTPRMLTAAGLPTILALPASLSPLLAKEKERPRRSPCDRDGRGFDGDPNGNFGLSAGTYLDMNQTPADMMDFFGVNGAAQPPITRVRCPVLAWFGSKEPDIGTDADLKRLRELIARHPQGPARVDTMILDGADHLYSG